MELKINNITDPDRTSVDRWKNLKGHNATRETRMEVVAWIAVCLFDCRLEGGFIRDWVVGNYSSKPTNLPINQWVSFHPINGLPILNKDLVPSDLDVHLPALKQFDIEAFVDTLYSYGITAQIYRQDWRYVLLLDENYKTGPFTIDLIEPHTIGTTIHSDEWAAYRSLRNNPNYIHLTANHSVNFVEPMSGVHTQNIENTWMRVKRKQKKTRRNV
jgi:hypothetical protein